MQDVRNRRGSQRLVCRVPATLQFAGTGADATLLDLSPEAVAITTGALVDCNEAVQVQFDLAGGNQMLVEARGKVLRNDNGRIAVRLTSLDALSAERLSTWMEPRIPQPDKARATLLRLAARRRGRKAVRQG